MGLWELLFAGLEVGRGLLGPGGAFQQTPGPGAVVLSGGWLPTPTLLRLTPPLVPTADAGPQRWGVPE